MKTEYPIKHLVPMTDFVLSRMREPLLKDCPTEIRTIHRYAEFLKQLLQLEMFIPVNGEEKVLFKNFYPCIINRLESAAHDSTTIFFQLRDGKDIESIASSGVIELTDTALKQIFG